jgi:hypothetical protein
MASRAKAKLWRYWGYAVAAILIISVLNNAAGPATYAVLTGVLVLYILFQAPATCAAINRIAQRAGEVDYCRNNSGGMLLGCHIRQHKFQKLKGVWWAQSWRNKTKGMLSGGPAIFATLTGIIGTITGIFGMVNDLVGK